MDVGAVFSFQQMGDRREDGAVWRENLRLADMVEPLGLDGIWSTEHHFTDYQVAPSPTQFLSYMAGRTSRVKLGSCATILPWHDPVRVAEEYSLLDILSNGRAIMGIGRGLGQVEFDGFRVPMSEARDRFVEGARIVMDALETGNLSAKGNHYPIPDRHLRPHPERSFRERTYAAAVSPESFDAVIELGLGLMCVVQKPWEIVQNDFANYRERFLAKHARPAPKSLAVAFVYCDNDAQRAKDHAEDYIERYYNITMEHYNLTGEHFANTPGYEYYAKGAKTMKKAGDGGAARFFRELQVYGTPKQCVEKIMHIADVIDADMFAANISYGGLPAEAAEASLRLFAQEVAPRLKAASRAKAESSAVSA